MDRDASGVVYRSRIRVERVHGPHRHAWLPALEGPVDFGVHGAIAAHYGAEPDVERPTTLDFVIAAAAG